MSSRKSVKFKVAVAVAMTVVSASVLFGASLAIAQQANPDANTLQMVTALFKEGGTLAWATASSFANYFMFRAWRDSEKEGKAAQERFNQAQERSIAALTAAEKKFDDSVLSLLASVDRR